MSTISIQIDEILIPILERISSENNLTLEQYASNIVKSFLEGQYRGELISQLKYKSITELRDLVIKNVTIKLQ